MRCLLVALVVCCSCAAEGAEKVTVATLNCEFLSTKFVHVKFGLKLDRKDWTDAQKAAWDAAGFRDAQYLKACKTVASAIKRIDADVIVLTEVARVPKMAGAFVTPNDLTILHDELKTVYPHLAFADSADTKTHQNVAVLSKRAFEPDSVRHTIPGREGYFGELDDPESEAEARVTKGLSVAVKMNGQPVRVYGVHLKSERGGHEADAQRIAQASIVRRNYLKELAAKTHVIVVGDLNDHRAQPALRRIRGFDDLGEDLSQTGGPTFFKQTSSETNADFNARIREHWTYEFAGRRNQIDHILISQSVRNHCTQKNNHKKIHIEFVDITETIAGTTHKASDHRAVKLTLEFLDNHQ